MKEGKKLQVVSKHGVGVDNVVDVATATRLGLYVVRTPLANMDSVAEHTLGAILAMAKNMLPLEKAARKADFDAPLSFESHDIGGKTLGIIGLGNIGRTLAKKAHGGFDMEILGYDPFVKKEDLPDYITCVEDVDDIFRRADYVSLHLNASPENDNFVDKRRLELMKPGACLLNFSRGSNVNEADLYEALKNRVIAGAALDVFAQEPVRADNPLLSLDNVVLSPHCAALTVEAMDRMSYQGCQGIVEILKGEKPTWCMNYEEVRAMREKG
ncbi:NAD(P)-dependent oxidoreductase [Enterocloster asparagiformis]|uniref:4-phosphoerythronate dehydrogenase n=1 Tax=[Clostridium] asparagiforme DSM 15981 TaxID=518636 RepID=C0CYI3_9FIRM|nr:NAD(P)-dependent oxidoreductase [Enterocloster asparagiformis]EEG55860.1 4-phosphoerythronate dehydrogenase [[Clostridium] asparagiforme DSM 15981]UWO75247.1 NAD(P)-binding domain-containing protein [[Clostridium] asparagiforme DSM 15981]